MTLQILNYNNIELKELANNIQIKGHQVFYDQELDADSYTTVMKRFGDCETPDLFMNPKDNPEIFIVTGKRDKQGKKLGMFGDTELGWHSNGNSRHNVSHILIGLYCVEGDENTTLSICHTAKPFDDLSEEQKEYYRNITIKLKFKNDTIYHLEDGDPELEFMSASKGSIRKLVGKHPHTSQEYFYFPYHFITNAWEGKKKIDANPMIQDLKNIIFKSKYQTHHIFHKGDLVLMDQFTSLHRRTPVYDNKRLLWRVASDYSKI
jgi:alpha-ketoglutarate-dependent taurine dioxygenase